MPTVLVADDNSNIQKMVALALEDQGISVVAVGNGEAAVRKLGEVQPDVVLADVFMPVRNGYEVCEFVKKDSRFGHVPVILLIGAFDPFDENEARRVGANGVLKKPFVPPDPLIAMVTGFISGLEKEAAPATTAQEVHTPEHPPASVASDTDAIAESSAEPDHESAPEEFTVGQGGLSLQEEDRQPEEPAMTSAPELPSEQRWEERIANWRREAIGYEIPADIAEPSQELSSSETTETAFIPEQPLEIEEALHEEPQNVSSEVGQDAALMRNPTEWMEMMSSSTQAAPAEPETSSIPTSPAEVEGRRSIFHPERIAPQQPPASESTGVPSDSEAVFPFRARTEAEALPDAFHEHPESPQPETPQSVHEHAETEPHQEDLSEKHPAETSHETTTFEPQPPSELFGFIQSPSYASDAIQTEERSAFGGEGSSYAPPQELNSAGSHVESYSAPPSLDPALVDAVVAKVLERIEPQLRNILTHELLRPLAESLLERELQKK